MKATMRGCLAALVALGAGAGAAMAEEHDLLNAYFSDHMVIQAGKPVTVWGKADPGAEIEVTLAGTQVTATAGEYGTWTARLPALEKGGGPYSLIVRGEAGELDTVTDILAGDVFLCSGQSNMEWPLSAAKGGGFLTGSANNEQIRLLTVEKDSVSVPKEGLDHGETWQVLSPETAGGFSAVCYLTAADLQRTHPGPMGLIDSSWGGSQIEAWMTAVSLGGVPGYEDQLALLQQFSTDPRGGSIVFGGMWEEWWSETVPEDPEPWALPAGPADGWKGVPVEPMDWTQYDDDALKGYTGIVLFRTAVKLTAEQAAQPATLNIGGIDEVDTTWVNGGFLRTTFGWGTVREYEVPADMLVEGANTITVAVYNSWGQGGMVGPGDIMGISFPDDSSVPMGGGWEYKKAPPQVGEPPRAPWESVSGLTGMYNGMIAPLGPIELTGYLWYQGESNAGKAGNYDQLLSGMLADIRAQFGPKVPALIVQLPEFGGLQSGPTESGWATIRDKQRRAAAADPLTLTVSTMGVGDRWDIHPVNKTEVARRLAVAGRALFYGDEDVTLQADPVRARRGEDGTITVTFDNVSEGLMVVGDEEPAAFELCDENACQFVEAFMGADGESVLLPPWDGAVKVRHGWADVPVINLYDETGAAVPSFELDIE